MFVLGSVSGAINDLALFDTHLPTPGYHETTQAEIMQVSEQTMDAGLNPFFIFFVIQTVGRVLISGLITCATVLPLLLSYGVPAALAIMIQGPIWIVEGFGIYQLITGYNMQGME